MDSLDRMTVLGIAHGLCRLLADVLNHEPQTRAQLLTRIQDRLEAAGAHPSDVDTACRIAMLTLVESGVAEWVAGTGYRRAS